MTIIASYVFLDLETTGLPHLERNETKIVELSFVAALRRDIQRAHIGSKPFMSKLSLMFNPQRRMQAKAAELTGITNESLQNAPLFKDKIGTILTFLTELPKPICLVAHNGDVFDFKILLAELTDIGMMLPKDILCVDSIKGFRDILKGNFKGNVVINDTCNDSGWSDLEISSEDLDVIDALCNSFSNLPTNLHSTPKKDSKTIKVAQKRQSYKLTELYKMFLKKDPVNAHRAEDDCLMLLECVVANKEFLLWSDKNCKNIHNIEPLDRKKYKR